jgi:hypothetical protein
MARPTSVADTPIRRRVLIALLLATALVVAGSGCVGSGKTARVETLEPFPAPMHVVSTSTGPCRAGESGFDYRFIVVGPTTLGSDSALLEHVRSRGFYRTGLYTDDLPWATTGYQHGEYPIRVEAGTLDQYLDDLTPYAGPGPETLPKEVRDNASQYVLLALRPTDFACTTPL